MFLQFPLEQSKLILTKDDIEKNWKLEGSAVFLKNKLVLNPEI